MVVKCLIYKCCKLPAYKMNNDVLEIIGTIFRMVAGSRNRKRQCIYFTIRNLINNYSKNLIFNPESYHIEKCSISESLEITVIITLKILDKIDYNIFQLLHKIRFIISI